MSRIQSVISYFKPIFLIITAIVIINLILVFATGSYLQSAGSLLGSDSKSRLMNLFFIEGAAISVIGAYIASGVTATIGGAGAAGTYQYERTVSERAEYRKGQIASGIRLILVGSLLLVISVLLYLAF